MKLSIIIPVFNEAATLGQLLQRIEAVQLPAGWEKELIIVSDGSTDGTLTTAEQFQDQYRGGSSVKVLNNERNLGKGASLRRGIAAATADAILVQDADLEYDPRDYGQMLRALENGADVIYGTRFLRSEASARSALSRVPFFRRGVTTPAHRFVNWALTAFSNLFTGLRLTDVHTCLKLFRADVIKAIPLEEHRFGFCPEVTARLAHQPGLKLVEVPVSYRPRTRQLGKKVGVRDGLRALYCTVKYSLLPGELARAPGAPLPPPASSWLFPSVLLLIALSLVLRLAFFQFEGFDFRYFLSPWYDFLAQHGAWRGLGEMTTKVADYPPLYLYLLSLATLLPLPKLFAIKLISVTCDYVAAFLLWRIARRISLKPAHALSAALAFLFLPTVLMNSAVWGQCDAMYTACLLASLLYIITRRPVAAMVAFGLACSLKPQAVFWLPFLAGLIASGRLTWKLLWIPPATYIVSGVPAMLAGRPVADTLLHWAHVRNLPGLNHHAPNWYQWCSVTESATLQVLGLALAFIAALALVWWMKNGPRSGQSEAQWLVRAALLSVLLVPFFLPGMHERYFYPADVLAVFYAAMVPTGWVVVVLMQFASAFAYCPFLFGTEPVPEYVLPAAVLLALEWILLSGRFVHSSILNPQSSARQSVAETAALLPANEPLSETRSQAIPQPEVIQPKALA
jgi:Gpi18-like mannosyltransferase/glycosyltransferase involved in cell wall biosynthesis